MSYHPMVPGRGRWRLKGRGRRLACGLDPQHRSLPQFDVYNRHAQKRCRWCGQYFPETVIDTETSRELTVQMLATLDGFAKPQARAFVVTYGVGGR